MAAERANSTKNEALTIRFIITSHVQAAKELKFHDRKIEQGTHGIVQDHWEMGGIIVVQVRFDGDTFDRLVKQDDVESIAAAETQVT